MSSLFGFLMYRVELKDLSFVYPDYLKPVPNAPCGVERAVETLRLNNWVVFLMHRVELKVGGEKVFGGICNCS